jgi:hypothetical protein
MGNYFHFIYLLYLPLYCGKHLQGKNLTLFTFLCSHSELFIAFILSFNPLYNLAPEIFHLPKLQILPIYKTLHTFFLKPDSHHSIVHHEGIKSRKIVWAMY